MALDVETPEEPDVTNRGFPAGMDFEADETPGSEADFRREEVEEVLREGAWEEAFREWAEYTDLNEAEYRAAGELGLLRQLDFYWDPVVETLRFDVPDVPADGSLGEELASRVSAELADLGETVIDRLADGYVDWDGVSDDVWEEEGVPENAWSEEAVDEDPADREEP